jgi:hypothetical protein
MDAAVWTRRPITPHLAAATATRRSPSKASTIAARVATPTPPPPDQSSQPGPRHNCLLCRTPGSVRFLLAAGVAGPVAVALPRQVPLPRSATTSGSWLAWSQHRPGVCGSGSACSGRVSRTAGISQSGHPVSSSATATSPDLERRRQPPRIRFERGRAARIAWCLQLADGTLRCLGRLSCGG